MGHSLGYRMRAAVGIKNAVESRREQLDPVHHATLRFRMLQAFQKLWPYGSGSSTFFATKPILMAHGHGHPMHLDTEAEFNSKSGGKSLLEDAEGDAVMKNNTVPPDAHESADDGVTYEVYQAFWSLHKFLKSPDMLNSKDADNELRWARFHPVVTKVLDFLDQHTIPPFAFEEACAAGLPSLCLHKYITDAALFRTQLKTPKFRRLLYCHMLLALHSVGQYATPEIDTPSAPPASAASSTGGATGGGGAAAASGAGDKRKEHLTDQERKEYHALKHRVETALLKISGGDHAVLERLYHLCRNDAIWSSWKRLPISGKPMGTKSEDEINKILQSDPRDVLETPDPHPTNTFSLQEHGIANPYFRAHDRGTETDMVVMAEGAAHKASARPKRDFCAAFGPGGAIAARVSRVKPFPRRVAGMLSD
uniref:Uncharacterized protein n=1 Tax=Vitrella brassicaformis TaxID=1169539 RepID=A0A7S1P2A2_9ALVE